MPNILHVAKLITVIRWHHSRMKRITTINTHPGDWRQSRFLTAGTGTVFLFVPHLKNAFSLMLHRQRKSLAKRKPDENGVLLKKKRPKAHAHYSKFSAKVTSWKYHVTKGGSPGHLILAPGRASRWVHSDWKTNLTRTFVPEFSFRYCLGQKFFLTGEPDAKIRLQGRSKTHVKVIISSQADKR